MTKGKWASPRRWHDWRVAGPEFPVELIVTRPYPRPAWDPDDDEPGDLEASTNQTERDAEN